MLIGLLLGPQNVAFVSLGSGMIFASFHNLGNTPLIRLVLKMWLMGLETCTDDIFNNLLSR